MTLAVSSVICIACGLLTHLVRALRKVQLAWTCGTALSTDSGTFRRGQVRASGGEGSHTISPLFSLILSLVKISFVSCLMRPLMSLSARLSSFCCDPRGRHQSRSGVSHKILGNSNLLGTQPAIPYGSIFFPFGKPTLELLDLFPVPLKQGIGIDNFLLDSIQLDKKASFR